MSTGLLEAAGCLKLAQRMATPPQGLGCSPKQAPQERGEPQPSVVMLLPSPSFPLPEDGW